MHRELAALFDLSGRAAIVTGGSRGIGRAIAQGLARAGASVVVAARDPGRCDEAAASIRDEGGDAIGARLELGDPDTLAPLVERTVDAFGRIDVLINNAAVLRPHRIERLTLAELKEVERTNVRGPVLLSRLALPHLEAGGHGAIVNLGAVAGHRPMRGLGAYGASKAALLSWTRVMAQEWSPRGVRVNALTPGSVATDMILPADAAERARFVDEMAAESLLGRVASAAEMVGPALFLASDASAYMTGQVLVIDGGRMA